MNYRSGGVGIVGVVIIVLVVLVGGAIALWYLGRRDGLSTAKVP